MPAASGKGKILICSPNWLGDSLMAMPAVRMLKDQDPSQHVTVLAMESLLPLWELFPVADALIPLQKRFRGAMETARAVREGRFDRAYILPHSLRAAILCFQAHVPVRAGIEGYRRGWMLTRQVARDTRPLRVHQAFEYLDVLGLDEIEHVDPLRLILPAQALEFAERILEGPEPPSSAVKKPLVALLPGAARGRAKQWPPEHFIALGRRLAAEARCRILLLGAGGELALCSGVAEGVGEAALNLAGRTSIPELAALLSRCGAVVANDSGGMHLAAAVGTRVAAVFGTTDPMRTGPMGPGHLILQEEGARRDRSVKRNSRRAREALRRVDPDRVYLAVLELLGAS